MSRMTALGIAILTVCSPFAQAHYHMLLPARASVQRDEAVLLTLQWGHPFEHQLFDMARPTSLHALAPDGQRLDLHKDLEKDPTRKTAAFRVQFTPQQRGDYLLVLEAAPVWMEEDTEFLQDTVKVVLHVQAQKGWEVATGRGFELIPLTRPYGLSAGTVFQTQVQFDGKPLAGSLLEIERYNPVPPKVLPPEEQMTRTVRTDPNGVVTCSLPESGWWCITAQRLAGKKEHKGKDYPLRQRSTFWVYVDEKK